MKVQVSLNCGGAWHSRGVVAIRQSDDTLEISRAHESPALFPVSKVSGLRIEMEESEARAERA